MDSATMLLDKHSIKQPGKKISENRKPYFSKSGKRLFFGTEALAVPRDTTLVEIDLVKLDVWHYKDDYLQTQQISSLSSEPRESDLFMYDLESKKILQLSSQDIPVITTSVVSRLS